MSDPQKEKSFVEETRDIITQLKEIEHYSQNNIEKLSEFWLTLDDYKDHKDLAERINQLLISQNAFQEIVTAVIEELDTTCSKIEKEAK